MTTDMWSYSGSEDWSTMNLVGYTVHASDGDIGKVDEASSEVGAGYLVVDTGPWIFGKKVMLPAGLVSNVDHNDSTVFVNRTKDQIKDAPEFDSSTYRSADYRDSVGGYYDRDL